MKVYELIKELEKYNKDLEITICDGYMNNSYYTKNKNVYFGQYVNGNGEETVEICAGDENEEAY